MITLNEHEIPPGGWSFLQPQTGWRNPMAMVGLDASIKAIIAHRQSNQAITIQHQLSTDYDGVKAELMRFTRIRLKIPEIGDSGFFRAGRNNPPSRGGVAAAGASFARQIVRSATGVATLADWLGNEGKPVEPALSEARATICATCPQNKAGDLMSFFTRPVAELLRRQLEERRNMNLRTSLDEKIGVCDACGCPIKLKVHVPLSFIKAHIQKPERDLLDPRCWILKEQ